MNPISIRGIPHLFCALLFTVLCSTAQTVSDSGAPSAPKNAEQVYKNIQVLKGVPADQLIPAMEFITASLGVQCDFCHLENAFEKDDKEPKQSARKMIQMMFTLNKDNFQGQQKVTCYACHRGSHKPVITPEVREGDKMSPIDAPPQQLPNAARLSSADSIVQKYLDAVGGVATLAKISTRIQQGTLTIGQKSFPVEVLSEAPDKRLTTIHFADGDNITVVNAKEGWTSTPGRPVRSMPASELEGARLETELLFTDNLRTLFKQLKVLGKDKINGKDCLLIAGDRDNSLPTYLYFDAESGLLVRMLRYTQTPLGNNPTEIDYSDYREQDGLKISFRWIVSRPNRRFSIQIEKMQQNVPIDHRKFSKPVVSSSLSPGTPPLAALRRTQAFTLPR